ncbi:MAG: NAD(P)H-quinone oxidoreductase [Pseudomonadota bacterium]
MTETMQAVDVTGDGTLQLSEADKPVPADGEVLIAIEAAGLNRADLLQKRGLYPPPPGASAILGLECAGTIEAVGAGVTRFRTGDRVCALLAGGGYAQYTAVDEGSVLPVPETMGFVQAACLPEAMMTVWANVFQRCSLKAGEAFLVHGGTSGIGVMAIQMAKAAGASAIFATAGSDEKCATCVELGATRAINYRSEDFSEIIKAEGGVDVVLDMVGGAYVQKNIDLVRLNGRVCNIAYQNGAEVTLNLMRLMLKRAILTGTTLRARTTDEKKVIRDAVEADFWPKVLSGDIRPVLDSTFPIADAEAAHTRMTEGGHVGKIVLEV